MPKVIFNVTLKDILAFFLILLIIPFPSTFSLNENTKDQQIDLTNLSQIKNEIESSILKTNYLFHVDTNSFQIFKNIFQEINPSVLHFYENLKGFGFVSLTTEEFRELNDKYPKLQSRLIKSELAQVFPSDDDLLVQSIYQQDSYQLPVDLINARDLWNEGYEGNSIKIAIIDSGIDNTHPDFSDRIVYEESFVTIENGFSNNETTFDEHGHGTHVAGIAAGGGSQFPGVAPKSELYNLKVADMTGHATEKAFIEAIDKAISLNVDIISVSLGFSISSPWKEEDLLSQAVNEAVESGIIVIVAAGNEGSESPKATINSPASAKYVVTVGASNGSNSIASFSSRGPSFNFIMDPDIIAPGVGIYAPLADGSVIKLGYNSIRGVNLDKYIPLTGTSMASPVVAGAAALLLQKFPDLKPESFRAAIQETAILLDNVSKFSQGNGLLDVKAAANLLDLRKISNGYNIISSEPKGQVEFAETATFPGDTTYLTIPFVTGMTGTVTWAIDNEIKDIIEFDTNPVVLTEASYFEKILRKKVPLNFPAATYSGNITYIFQGIEKRIPISVSVTSPRTKLYLNSHYTGIEDSRFYNYHDLDSLLTSELFFDINEYSGSIDWGNLSINDILVLSDLEFPFSSIEINFIKRFHDLNGSILLVSSAYPFFNPIPYDQIAKALEIPVNYLDQYNIINYTDDGREISPILRPSPILTYETTNEFLDGVFNIQLNFGSAIYGNLSDSRLSNSVLIEGTSYLAATGFNPLSKGKVVLLSSELWLYSSSLKNNDGQAFIKNIFEWLKPNDQITVNINYLQDNRTIEVVLYPSSKLPTTLEVFFTNGTQKSISLMNDSIYDYARFSLAPEAQNEIIIQVLNGSNLLKEFSVIDTFPEDFPQIYEITISSPTPAILPSWAEDYPSVKFSLSNLEVLINHTSSPLIEARLLITNQPEISLDFIAPPIDTLDIISKELIFNKSDSNDSQGIIWMFPSDLPTSFYSYEVQIWFELENITILITYERDYFFKPDSEPIFGMQSTIHGRSLEEYQKIETTKDIYPWNGGETVTFNLIPQDTNSERFTVYVQLIHYYLWFAERTVLQTFEIPFIAEENRNIGTFIIPEDTIPVPNSEYEIEISNQLFILLLFLRDLQGNIAIEVIFCIFDQGFILDPSLLIIGMLFGIIAVAGLVIFFRNRSRGRKAYYSYRYTSPDYFPRPSPTLSMKYCGFCGNQIPLQSRFCSFCGKKLTYEGGHKD